jgi:uncharacterized protein (DUF1501 family)
MKRREFLEQVLKRSALAIGGTALTSVLPNYNLGTAKALAQTAAGVPAGSKRFIFIFCRGGFDTLAMFTPTDRTVLNTLRPASMQIDPTKALKIGLPYDAHPGLTPVFFNTTGVKFNDVAVVIHSGSMNDTRSHFQQQDFIESGSILQKTSNGFLARLELLNQPKTLRPPLCIGPAAPFSLQGCDPSILPSANAVEGGWSLGAQDHSGWVLSKSGLPERLPMFSSALATSTGATLRTMSSKGIADAKAIKAAYDAVKANTTQPNRPASAIKTSFSAQIELASMMCRSSYNPNVVTLDYGSWDTHSGEGINTGYFASMATDLGNNLGALRDELVRENEWNDTVVCVISEFGRTAISNVAQGTDHGRGTAMIIMGGNVNPNHSNSTMPIDLGVLDGVAGSAALTVKVDWRTVVGEILQKHLAADVSTTFDSFAVDPSTFLKVMKS